MKMARIVLATALLAAGVSQASAQEPKKAPGSDAAASRPEMPDPKTPEHAVLARFAGEWDIKLTMHMGPEPATVTAMASEKLALGGLYLVTIVSGDMGDATFEGRGITAWDRHAKEYVSVWVDVDSHTPAFSRGTFDSKTGTMAMKGELSTPAGMLATRTVSTFKGDDTRNETVYAKGPDGSEKLFMEFVYTRRKEPAPLKAAPVDQKSVAEELSKLAGKWSAHMAMTQKTPEGDKPLGTGQGTETCKLVCGGKWLWTELDSDFGGMKHIAYAIIGYDPESKKYHAIWCDNHGGSFDVAEGKSDGKTRSMEGTTYDPTKGRKIKWSETSTWKDANNRMLTWKVEGSESMPATRIDVTYVRVE